MAVTVTPPAGIAPNCITAVSSWVPVLATMVAPAGNTQVMGVVPTFVVTQHLIWVPGQALVPEELIVNTGLGATTIYADCGELQ